LSATSRERSRSLPTGTVTFAFTDIEGSTARWERDRAGMQDAVRRHDASMRATITAHDGVVFKTIGDAFCAAFARPEDAVAAMLDAQRALAAEDFSAIDGLRVRAAIHTGTSDEREGDYFGPAVNRVARLLAIGNGGQVLVSRVTADLVQGALPPQVSLRDLGTHRLRDLALPEYVYQLVAPDLAAEFPALRSLDALPNNLPRMMTSFVGREAEISEITALVGANPVVTLVGSGGVGKTRASLQIAANLLDGTVDGVWFIELAPLASGDYIPSTVAHALGITLPPEGDQIEHLTRALKAKRTLLVFDNCEHMVEPAARVISAILRACPTVKILASSRQCLGIAGEATYRMPSLDVPRDADRTALTAAASTQYAAISLFGERARAVDYRFELTDDNAPIVADICRRLDGIPLAIELAASRVRIFSPQQINERLSERFRMLTGGSRDVLPRQQTLRALIDWSYDLLDESERLIFRRLGIFVNGFTYEGAVAVASGEDLDEFELFDLLTLLVDKSLVLAEPQADAIRYRLLESTRAYASERLDAAGERESIAERHLRHFRDRFVELYSEKERSARSSELNSAFTVELEDLRFALDRALMTSNIVEGADLLSSIDGRWQMLGLDLEGIRRIENYAVALAASESRLLSRLSSQLSAALSPLGQRTRSFTIARDAVAQARASADGETLAIALRAFGNAAKWLRRFDEAEAAIAEVEAIPTASRNLRLQALADRADLADLRGDSETAAQIGEQLRKDHQLLGNFRAEMVATINLAEIEHGRGNTSRAIEILHQILPAMHSGKDRGLLGNVLNNLTAYFISADDTPNAVRVAEQAIRTSASVDTDHVDIGIAIEHLALTRAMRGDLMAAARQEGYSDALFIRSGFERELTEATTYDRLMALLRGSLSPDELARLLAEGAALTPEAAIALALADAP
jgi:predicted ATPase/class 3 adenylate cyclase